MDAKTKFLEIKQAWKKANENERQLIEQETDKFFESLSVEGKRAVCDAVNEDFEAIHKEIGNIKEVLDIREKLMPVLPAISVSYLAKNYFHKTPQWFYQRMNGNKVNGKQVAFTQQEINTLNFAIKDIGNKLNLVQL